MAIRRSLKELRCRWRRRLRDLRAPGRSAWRSLQRSTASAWGNRFHAGCCMKDTAFRLPSFSMRRSLFPDASPAIPGRIRRTAAASLNCFPVTMRLCRKSGLTRSLTSSSFPAFYGSALQTRRLRSMALLKALTLRAQPVDIRDALGIESEARRWHLPAYDAAYLALARDSNLPLATTDAMLRAVAEAQGIQVL